MQRNIKKKVIAPWSKCTFSNKPQYKNMCVADVYKIDSAYIKWCVKNLDYISWNLVKEYLIKS
jgi:hypothetical protein